MVTVSFLKFNSFLSKHKFRDSQIQDLTDSSSEAGSKSSLERASALSDGS